MRTIVPVAVATAVLALLGVTAAGVLAGGEPGPTIGTTGTTETTGTAETTETTEATDTTETTETSEAATTVERTTARTDTVQAPAREPGEDVRGPCDEAEHANDPRCTGTGADGDDDRSGRGRGGRDDDADDDDRSGSNRGPG